MRIHPAILASILISLSCAPGPAQGQVASTPSTALAPASQPDFSTPENTCRSLLLALKSDDEAAFRACFSPVNPADAPLLQPVLSRMFATHCLVQSLAARFGHDEAHRMDDWAMGDDADIDRMLALEVLQPHPHGAEPVVIRLHAREYTLQRQNSQWKVMWDNLNKDYSNQLDIQAHRLGDHHRPGDAGPSLHRRRQGRLRRRDRRRRHRSHAGRGA